VERTSQIRRWFHRAPAANLGTSAPDARAKFPLTPNLDVSERLILGAVVLFCKASGTCETPRLTPSGRLAGLNNPKLVIFPAMRACHRHGVLEQRRPTAIVHGDTGVDRLPGAGAQEDKRPDGAAPIAAKTAPTPRARVAVKDRWRIPHLAAFSTEKRSPPFRKML